MWWRDVAFLSWRCDPQAVIAHVPPGIEIDLYAGSAWVSVVPFRITGARAAGVPLPLGFGNAPEINLRTYVRVNGRPGIYFFSLDAASRALVRGARVSTGLPYFDARISTEEKKNAITYISDRTRDELPGGTFSARYVPQGKPATAQPGSLAEFLCERYRFFVRRRDDLYVGEVEHQPWELEDLDVRITRNTLGAPLGLPLGNPNDVRFGRGVRVRAATVRRVAD